MGIRNGYNYPTEMLSPLLSRISVFRGEQKKKKNHTNIPIILELHDLPGAGKVMNKKEARRKGEKVTKEKM